MLRSSRPEVFCEKGVLKNFANFTEKHLRWKLQHKCLPVKLAKFLRPPFFTGQFRRLLLNVFSLMKFLVVRQRGFPANIYLFKSHKRCTRKRCESAGVSFSVNLQVICLWDPNHKKKL